MGRESGWKEFQHGGEFPAAVEDLVDRSWALAIEAK